jgi:hypothetical protein
MTVKSAMVTQPVASFYSARHRRGGIAALLNIARWTGITVFPYAPSVHGAVAAGFGLPVASVY